MTARSTAAADTWAAIERERQRDRLVKRLCIATWSATLLLAVLFTVIVGISVAQMVRAAMTGALPWMSAVGAALPLMGFLWTLSLLVSALSTVGVFLRFRTSSLAEIQLRLAALEELLTSKSDAEP
jgi:hypothetical protein